MVAPLFVMSPTGCGTAFVRWCISMPSCPITGKSVLEYLPDAGKDLRLLAALHGEGWKVPPISAAAFAVNATDASWVDRQCTMHPLSTIEAPARIAGACDSVENIGYILARGFPDSPFEQFDVVAERRGWWREQIACGH